ncbi:MAG TPA: R3H domain-containing nucleic acid-binding protein [Fimbriimonadaceae bacterium]|nr:R3H domain-containing nucleic acid-binding protein [Fimbriimonadaceae bacterium]
MSSVTNGLGQFSDVLPAVVRERLEKGENVNGLIEVVLDYGRPAEARYIDRAERMEDVIVSEHDIDYVTKSIGDFGLDNRAGIERTLHRISCIRNRHGKVIGLTCRVGRALEGTIEIIDDIVRSGQSILILGRPGVGKTTKLREVARVLADEVGKRVVIVDTSNEIAGDGDVPHPGIGGARRMQVRIPSEQHQVMIEAVENHMPEVIVIDEIGTEQEAMAARTINERGVQLVGTAHGQTLENLMLNPTLCDLIGGIQAVTLSDDEARRRGTQKTVLERKAPPTFDVVLELLDFERLAVHHNVMKTVDLILRGVPPRAEIRVRNQEGKMEVVQREDAPDLEDPSFNRRYPSLSRSAVEEDAPATAAVRRPEPSPPRSGLVRIFPYGIARTRLERAIREKRAMAYIVNDIQSADAVMAIRANIQAKPRKIREMAGRSLPTVVVKSNTYGQIAAALDDILRTGGESKDFEAQAMDEVMQAIDIVTQTGKPYDLAPQPAPIRKMQHQMTEAKRLASESVGEEPHRRLRVLPVRLA